MQTISSNRLHSESGLFSSGIRAGEFTYVSQDARGPDGSVPDQSDGSGEARRTIDNLRLALNEVGQDLGHLVSLLVLMTDYGAIGQVSQVLDDYFPDPERAYPATCFVGVPRLDGGVTIRIDALASDSPDRSQILAPGVPLAEGNRCHGVRVGDLFFLSGVDGGDEIGAGEDITSAVGRQTGIVLDRIAAILQSQGLSLADLVRNFNYLCAPSDTAAQSSHRDSRRQKFGAVSKPEEFPANTRVWAKSLGENILYRAFGIATRSADREYVESDKIRSTPGIFSQCVRVGPWLFPSGMDSYNVEQQVIGANLEEQTVICLTHIKNIVEAAGGSLSDVVKTTVYLLDGQDRDRFASVYQDFLKANGVGHRMPAGLTFGVTSLAPSCLVEIDSVAYLPARG